MASGNIPDVGLNGHLYHERVHIEDDRDSILKLDSNYFDADNIDELSSFVSAKYCALHLNIQSLPSKFVELKILLHTLETKCIHIHFILLSETWLTDNNSCLFNIPGYTFVHRSRTIRKHGGVAMYISNSISFNERPDLEEFIEGEFESIFIEVKAIGLSKKLIVGEIYRPPNTNERQSIANYERVLTKICNSNCDVLIGTDQNFNFMYINNNKNVSDLFDVFYTLGLVPTITRPTRVTHTTATLIDNIYIRANNMEEIVSKIMVTPMSDHYPQFISIGKNSETKKKEPLVFYHRHVNENSTLGMLADLKSTSWINLATSDSINDAYASFMDTLTKILDKHAPLKKVTISPRSIIREPWMNASLLSNCRTRDRLYRKCRHLDKKTRTIH